MASREGSISPVIDQYRRRRKSCFHSRSVLGNGSGPAASGVALTLDGRPPQLLHRSRAPIRLSCVLHRRRRQKRANRLASMMVTFSHVPHSMRRFALRLIRSCRSSNLVLAATSQRQGQLVPVCAGRGFFQLVRYDGGKRVGGALPQASIRDCEAKSRPCRCAHQDGGESFYVHPHQRT